MNKISNELVVEKLKLLIDDAGIKLTELANGIGVPYRTLQNQFSGSSKMSASTALSILHYLGVSSDLIVKENSALNGVAMSMALQEVFGDYLPTVSLTAEGEFIMEFPAEPNIFTRAEKSQNATWLGALIERSYFENLRLNLKLFYKIKR